MHKIIHILKVFQLASGLKINLHKSKLVFIRVQFDFIQLIVDFIGCSAIRIPFVYLGLLIGGNVNKIASWKLMTDIFVDKLSTWIRNYFLLEVVLHLLWLLCVACLSITCQWIRFLMQLKC